MTTMPYLRTSVVMQLLQIYDNLIDTTYYNIGTINTLDKREGIFKQTERQALPVNSFHYPAGCTKHFVYVKAKDRTDKSATTATGL